MLAGPRQRQRLILHLGVHFGAAIYFLFCGCFVVATYSADDVEVLPKKGSAGNNCKCEGGVVEKP